MNLKESIKGNTKQFIQNVIDYLDSYCEDDQGWLDMEDNILNLQKYTRYHSINEAIREYVTGGSLDVYYNQVNDTLNKLYENTPEEIKKWEKYPDEKKWERYINIMQLYIPKAFKKKMGRALGENIPEEYVESSKKSISPIKEKMFSNAVRKFAETLDKDIYPVAKVQCKMIEKVIKNGDIKNESLSNLVSEFKVLEEKVFSGKIEERGLTKAEKYNRDMEKIFDFAKKLRKAKEDYLIAHGVSEDEVKELSAHTGIGGDALQQKLIDMGIKDDFYKEFKDGMRESRKSGNLKKIKEDYGWEVSYDNIWNLYEDMKEAFGAEELLESIVRAMGTYDLGDTLTYICRMNDYNSQYLERHEEDEEEELEEKNLDYKKKADESLSYEEALEKVHSGEWDASKFTESVVKGIVK